MGWLWSNKSADAAAPSQPSAPHVAEPVPPPPQPPASSPSSTTPSPSSRDEQADLELARFLEEINYNAGASNPPSTTTSAPSSSSQQTPSSSSSPSSTHNPSYSPISPAALYPSSMSCRAAFDAAYHCQLPGGQFVNVYRYGGLRDCSALWGDFWFCMRTNRGYMSEAERARRIKQRSWEREAKYRGAEGKSSEDVWEMRREKVEGAFEGDLGALEESLRREAEAERGG